MIGKYILDSSALQYMLEFLPRKLMEDIWKEFEIQCNNGHTISDRETKKMLDHELAELDSVEWVKNNSGMFKSLTQKESEKLGELVKEGVFDFYNNSTQLARKLPLAIPFLISMAFNQKRLLVIHKGCKDKKKIINICDKKVITCINVEDYLIALKNNIA